MRRLVVSAFVTLDGVMQAPGGPDEDPTGGFTLGGWSVPHWDEAMNEAMAVSFGQPFALLLGRRTYEIFAAHWPHVDDPAASALNAATKYVASRTLTEVTWENSVLLDGDVVAAVAALKEEDGPDLLTQGSSDLIQTLLTAGLVDELRVWTFPVLVGPGKRLFGTHTLAAGFELVEAPTSTTGVVMATYRRAGDVQRGAFTFDVPTDDEVDRRRRWAAEEERAS